MSSFKDYVILFLILVGLIVLSKIFITICQLWFNIEIDEYIIGFAVGMIFKDFYYGKKLSKLKKLGKELEAKDGRENRNDC
jgi:hypothetical protein